MREISVTVNGTARAARVEDRLLLADFLREYLGLTGLKVGCAVGSCGSCTVHVDGRAVRSCLALAVQADGRSVRTIEDVADEDGSLHPLQRAFQEAHGLQCGFCTPGFVMTALELVESGRGTDEGAVRAAIAGNICRCTGYAGIVEAITVAARSFAGTRGDGEA